MIINIQEISPGERQNYLQHAIAPRPIALASTINLNGEVNLSPFSFFNMFSSTPPIVIFSPARRVRNNSTKHTLENVLEVPEVVINIVDASMVQQVSLASCEYAAGINEFDMAGFTMQAAQLVKPPLVQESKVKMECKVLEVKPLGSSGGAGNLVIAEVLLMHIDESLLNENKMIDQTRLEHVARLGGDWYCRVNSSNLFKVAKPNTQLGIGVSALPESLRNSKILSGNDLGQLANVDEQPFINPAFEDDRLKQIVQYYSINTVEMERELQLYARELLEAGKVNEAWQVLLTAV